MSARNVPPLAKRCTYWFRGQQCPEPRATGSARCWLHGPVARHAAKAKS